MVTARIKFQCNLHEFNEDPTKAQGVIFHRWLPNGQADAITLPAGGEGTLMRVWFDRPNTREQMMTRGLGILRDRELTTVDDEILDNLGKLHAGSLHGMLEVQETPDDFVRAVEQNLQDDQTYVSFCKFLVKTIYNTLSPFVSLLKTKYGQYWLEDFPRWDSRQGSLGHFCSTMLRMRACFESGDSTWLPLNPSKNIIKVKGSWDSTERYLEFLTQRDWFELEKIFNPDYCASTASNLITATQSLLDREEYRYAYIEAVSAFDIAVEEFFRTKVNSLIENIKPFLRMPVMSQVTALGAFLGVSSGSIDDCLSAIETRNQITHEGLVSIDEWKAKRELNALLRFVSTLIGEGPRRFPSQLTGDAFHPNWDD